MLKRQLKYPLNIQARVLSLQCCVFVGEAVYNEPQGHAQTTATGTYRHGHQRMG